MMQCVLTNKKLKLFEWAKDVIYFGESRGTAWINIKWGTWIWGGIRKNIVSNLIVGSTEAVAITFVTFIPYKSMVAMKTLGIQEKVFSNAAQMYYQDEIMFLEMLDSRYWEW